MSTISEKQPKSEFQCKSLLTNLNLEWSLAAPPLPVLEWTYQPHLSYLKKHNLGGMWSR